jgi:hypothetical protein
MCADNGKAMRRMAVILALPAAGALLAACGSSGHVATTTVQHTAATAKGRVADAAVEPAASRSFNKAQAIAFAHAVNLRGGDVPGFKAASGHGEHETPAEKRLEGELTRCAGGVSRNLQVAEVGSKGFEREGKSGAQHVESGVTVVQTPALAAKELAAVRSERGRICILRFVTMLFKSQRYEGARVGHVSVSSGSPPAPGTTGGFGLRIATTITLHRVSIPFYMDLLGFVYGPAEVTLASFSLPEPFPAATEERLFALLLTRAKMHGA